MATVGRIVVDVSAEVLGKLEDLEKRIEALEVERSAKRYGPPSEWIHEGALTPTKFEKLTR